jgi:hypothetical protein
MVDLGVAFGREEMIRASKTFVIFWLESRSKICTLSSTLVIN